MQPSSTSKVAVCKDSGDADADADGAESDVPTESPRAEASSPPSLALAGASPSPRTCDDRRVPLAPAPSNRMYGNATSNKHSNSMTTGRRETGATFRSTLLIELYILKFLIVICPDDSNGSNPSTIFRDNGRQLYKGRDYFPL